MVLLAQMNDCFGSVCDEAVSGQQEPLDSSQKSPTPCDQLGKLIRYRVIQDSRPDSEVSGAHALVPQARGYYDDVIGLKVTRSLCFVRGSVIF